MEAENARIGVARSAMVPALTLNVAAGDLDVGPPASKANAIEQEHRTSAIAKQAEGSALRRR